MTTVERLRSLRAKVRRMAELVGVTDARIPEEDEDEGWDILCDAIMAMTERHWDPW